MPQGQHRLPLTSLPGFSLQLVSWSDHGVCSVSLPSFWDHSLCCTMFICKQYFIYFVLCVGCFLWKSQSGTSCFNVARPCMIFRVCFWHFKTISIYFNFIFTSPPYDVEREHNYAHSKPLRKSILIYHHHTPLVEMLVLKSRALHPIRSFRWMTMWKSSIFYLEIKQIGIFKNNLYVRWLYA